MCIRDRGPVLARLAEAAGSAGAVILDPVPWVCDGDTCAVAVSYTHLRAHETVLDLVCRLLLEKKNNMRTGDR